MIEFKPISLSEQLIFSTVPIKVEKEDGSISLGTGFFFMYSIKDKGHMLFIVSNRHVIENSIKGKLLFHKAKDKDSAILERPIALEIDDFSKLWVKYNHDDIDISILPFTKLDYDLRKRNLNIFYRAIPHNIIPNKEQLENEINAIEDILFIGYPEGIYDKKNLIPVIRKGITATPISLDFEKKPQFLVDASVFPGSSGSPVFLYNEGSYPNKKGDIIIGRRIFFLGILSATHKLLSNIEYEEIEIEIKKIPGLYSTYLSNLGIVFKSNLIIELIENLIKGKENQFKILN